MNSALGIIWLWNYSVIINYHRYYYYSHCGICYIYLAMCKGSSWHSICFGRGFFAQSQKVPYAWPWSFALACIVGVDKRSLCQMLDLNIDTHRNKLLKYNSVLKAIKEQFLSKDITLNCWKKQIFTVLICHKISKSWTLTLKMLIIFSQKKKSARAFVLQNIQNDRWWPYQWQKNTTNRSCVKMPNRSNLNRNW